VKKTSIWCLIGFVIVALSCVALSVDLHAQGDTAQQIKELQQQSRDAQMKNDASWAQQHLADGFVAGNS
jgi:Ni/Co efflux regulator RcnB